MSTQESTVIHKLPLDAGGDLHASNNIRGRQLCSSTKPRSGKLAGKVCIITGVGSKKGIGCASALAFAHEGATHLYLLDFVGEHLPELEDSLKKACPDIKVTAVQGDATDEPTIAGLCQRALDEEGRLDVFFANVGIGSARLMSDTTPEHFMKIHTVNALSCFLAVKHGSNAMKRISTSKPHSAGSIVLTASVAGLRSGAADAAYSASKAAVNSLAQTGASHLRGSGIRVNSICPGFVETAMTAPVFDYARMIGSDARSGVVPLQRHGAAEEIAQVALYLACDDSSFVNGHNMVVDGGLSASHPEIIGPAEFQVFKDLAQSRPQKS